MNPIIDMRVMYNSDDEGMQRLQEYLPTIFTNSTKGSAGIRKDANSYYKYLENRNIDFAIWVIEQGENAAKNFIEEIRDFAQHEIIANAIEKLDKLIADMG